MLYCRIVCPSSELVLCLLELPDTSGISFSDPLETGNKNNLFISSNYNIAIFHILNGKYIQKE